MDVNKYTIRVEWSHEDNCYIARCLEFPSLGTHGDTRYDAMREMEVVLQATLEWMVEDGERIPEPLSERSYKGNISLRIPSNTHKELSLVAADKGISLNQLITSVIERNLYFDQIEDLRASLVNEVSNLQAEILKLQAMRWDLFYKQPLTQSPSYMPGDLSSKMGSKGLKDFLLDSIDQQTCDQSGSISA